jgi:hypothetical protein
MTNHILSFIKVSVMLTTIHENSHNKSQTPLRFFYLIDNIFMSFKLLCMKHHLPYMYIYKA